MQKVVHILVLWFRSFSQYNLLIRTVQLALYLACLSRLLQGMGFFLPDGHCHYCFGQKTAAVAGSGRSVPAISNLFLSRKNQPQTVFLSSRYQLTKGFCFS